MTSNVEEYAVDTSVAVAALNAGHPAHRACLEMVLTHRPALAGHAAFEVFSVLTRMPGMLAIDPADAAAALAEGFAETVWLAPDASAELLARFAVLGISGGAVYDALVGEAARTNRRLLLTRDQRARRTYDLLGVDYLVIAP